MKLKDNLFSIGNLEFSANSKSWPSCVFVSIFIILQYFIFLFFYSETIIRNSVFYYSILGILSALSFNFFERIHMKSDQKKLINPSIICLLVLISPVIFEYFGINYIFSISFYIILVVIFAIPFFIESSKSKIDFFSTSIISVLFCICHFLIVNSLLNADIFSSQRSLAGLLQIDTFYHAAISSMIQMFGWPSTGLDGVTLLRYHVFSHVWLGSAGSINGIDTISAYVLGRQLFALPLMYFLLINLSNIFIKEKSNNLKHLVAIFTSLLFIFSIFDWNSYLVSESHIFGIIFLSMLVIFLSNTSLDNSDIFVILIGFIFCFLATSAKISSGFAAYFGFSYFIVSQRKLSRINYALFFLLSLTLLLFAKFFILQESHAGQTRFFPFYFFRFFKVAVLNFGAVAAALWICLRARPEAWSRSFCHFMAVMLAASFVPALLFRIDYSAGYYVINTGTLLAFAVLAAWLVQRWEWGGSRSWLYALAGIVVAAPLHVVLSGSYSGFAGGMGPFDQGRLSAMSQAAARTPLATLAESIEAQRERKLRQIVYLMPGVDDINPYACQLRPFFIPAYVGLPLLMGLPDAQCDVGPHYSFVDYKLPPRITGPVTDAKICAAAGLRSFHHVIVVEDPKRARRLDCRQLP